MKSVIVPAILAVTVLIAGFFAFMPIEKAATVHSVIIANAIRMVTVDSATSTAQDQDMRITCPTTSSSGCRILEVYVEETVAGGTGVRVDSIDANVAGDPIATLVDINPDNTINDARELIPEAGGIAIGSGDTITLVTNDGATDNASRYQFRVIAEVEGNTTVTLSFV